MSKAGLTAWAVTEAGATLVDEIGFAQLSMGLLAERLGVKSPSLYKHVASQAHLARRIAILATNEFADSIRDAIQGRAGNDAPWSLVPRQCGHSSSSTPAGTRRATLPARPGPTTRSFPRASG